MNHYLAIDIGASSGRHIVGWLEDGEIKTKEVYRFPNGVTERDGHLVWDIDGLLRYVKEGIEEAKKAFPHIASLSIDTWGVDYVLLKDGHPIYPVYAYRDTRTERLFGKVHEKISFTELYRRTGCQFQKFNSIYQLYGDFKSGRLEQADNLLMIPEYLLYCLCGVPAREYTNATTMGLVNAQTREFDTEILEKLGYPKKLFPKLRQPGTVLGSYQGITCMLCATHDTASAVEGIPMARNQPYISSGTWSLLGVKTPAPITNGTSQLANYSNEGGVGYNRYQKNIMGMWLVNELKRELCPEATFPEILKAARESSCSILVDANAPEFLAPKSMKAAFDEKSSNALHTVGDYFRCAYRSLADSYRKALSELERNTGKTYEQLYIVGGGAKSEFLNDLTREATGKEVIALPIEATALGNLKVQMERAEPLGSPYGRAGTAERRD